MAKKYIPKLYDSDEVTLVDDIHDVIECKIREERNGIFELTLDYPASSPLLYEFKKERVIVANASPKLRNQMFVIYKVCRYMKKKIKVIARHISFDLLYDSCSELKLENASCEYVLNSLFRNSRFSREFRGFSDIINAQNYSIENVNILEAIAGKEGSIIDTFGTGAEILRDNKNFHVLKKRGHDNGVSIEYGINLTGFECYEDTTDLVTCIRPFATYRNEDSTEITVRGDFVESPRAGNYKHLYIKHIDYTNKFEAKEVPTPTKLNELAAQDFRTGSIDIPKMRYEIKFIPLSQCVGYENFQDSIGLCDILTVKNRVYNVDDKAKVVATVFDPIKDRYESMELGEPRSTLGSILSGSDGKDGQNGKDGKDGKDGQDGNVENMPDTLPETPVLTSKVYGMGSIELSWTFENKLYYNYELYASKIKDFKPNAFDLIHAGQSSSFAFKAKAGETWYFKVCAINSHNKRTPFSNQIEVITKKENDMTNYFSDLAIGNAVVRSLSADYMEAGIIKGNWIDMRHLTLTDGNGKRVFDCDDFGRLYADFSEFTINGSAVAQEDWVKTNISNSAEGLKQEVSNEYATKTEVSQTVKNWKISFEQPTNNIALNSNWNKSIAGWFKNGYPEFNVTESYRWINHDRNTLWLKNSTDQFLGLFQPFETIVGKTYTFVLKYMNDGGYQTGAGTVRFGIENLSVLNRSASVLDGWRTETITFTATKTSHVMIIYLAHAAIYAEYCQLIDGDVTNGIPPWTAAPNEILNSSTEITQDGILVNNGKIRIKNHEGTDVFWVDQYGQLCTDNIFIYGAEKDANLEIGGTGNKGIGIRSSSDGERYIDFCTVARGASWEQQVRSGQLTRLYARGGDFWIMPTNKLVIQSAQWGFVKERLDEIIVHSNESWFAGNVTAGGTLIAQDALRCRNIAHPEGGAGYVIHVHCKLNLMDGTTFSSGVFASVPRSSMFFRTLTEKPLDVLDSIEFIDKTKMPRFNSLTALPNETEENSELLMDVSNVVGTPYASIDENGNAVASYEELLKLALKEIKELKNEVNILKEKVGA